MSKTEVLQKRLIFHVPNVKEPIQNGGFSHLNIRQALEMPSPKISFKIVKEFLKTLLRCIPRKKDSD